MSIDIILASSSPSRKNVLSKLVRKFQQISPEIDETPMPDESAKDHVLRLSHQKALVISQQYPEALVIAGDQVISCSGQYFSKPLNHQDAHRQLSLMSDRSAEVITGLCVLHQNKNFQHLSTTVSIAQIRPLNDALITQYLSTDKPYGCAGSIALEEHGHLLIQSLDTKDPSAIFGIPLFHLTSVLLDFGLNLSDMLQP